MTVRRTALLSLASLVSLLSLFAAPLAAVPPRSLVAHAGAAGAAPRRAAAPARVAAVAPSSVTIAGTVDPQFGCSGPWQTDCAAAHMAYDAVGDVWTKSALLAASSSADPHTSPYQYKAALNDSWNESYGQNTGAGNITFTLTTPTTVTFFYDDKTHWVTDDVNSVIATVPGDYQQYLGCADNWQPSCMRSWLEDPTGSGTYSFSTTRIPAGTYNAKVAINRSWNENYGQGGAPGGANITFVVPTNGAKVTFRYDPATHVLSISSAISSGHGHDNNVEYAGLAHDSRNSLYRVPFGAASPGTPVALRFRTFHDDVTGVTIRLYDTAVGHEDREPMQLVARNVSCYDRSLDAAGNTCDYYQYTYTPRALGAVYYRFIATDGTATAYYADTANRYDGRGVATPDEEDYGFRLNVVAPAAQFPVIPWMQNGVMYQIFPDRFRNGDTGNDPKPTAPRYNYPTPQDGNPQTAANDQIQLRRWDQLPEGSCTHYVSPATPCTETSRGRDYFGGDLQGIDQKLDYLKRLGVTILYLNPIFASGSNHGYDTRDYKTISPYFGTNSYFAQNLVPDATARGMRIVLDGVFNHLSSDSPFFDRYHHYSTVGACEDATSPFRSWFTFHDVAQGAGVCVDSHNRPNSATYDGWAGFDSIPVLTKRDPASPDRPYAPVANYFYAVTGTASISATNEVTITPTDPVTSVAPYWLQQGAAGWRFDVMTDPSFPAAYWQQVRTVTKGVTPDATLIAEGWHWYDNLPLTHGDQADTAMGYRFRNAVLGLLGATDNKGFAQETDPTLPPSTFENRIMSMREDYADATWYTFQNLVDSHDTARVLWSLTPGADNREAREFDATNAQTGTLRQRVAALVQMTMPGTPDIYYGDEVGLTGSDDPDDRRPFPWTLDAYGAYVNTGDTTYYDAAGNHATFDWYKKLTGIRAANPALRQGKLSFLLADDTKGTLAYALRGQDGDPNKLVITLINRNEASPETINVPTASYLRDGVTFTDALTNSVSAATANGSLSPITLAPLGAAILVMDAGQTIAGPAAPTTLTAAAQDALSSTVALSWLVSADATGYNVYRSPVQGGGYVRIGSTAALTYTDTTVANGTTYYYVVRAVDAQGNEGDSSNEASATPALPVGYAVLQYPKTISETITSTFTTVYGQVYIHGLTDAGGDPGAIIAQVALTGTTGSPDSDPATWPWQPMTYNAGHTGDNNYEYQGRIRADAPGAYHYLVRFSDDGGGAWTYGDQNGSGTGTPGVATITASADTTAPTAPTLSVDYSASSLMLSWTPSTDPDDAVAEYRIYRGASSGGEGATAIATVSGSATAYTDTMVASGQTYDYVIRAYDTSLNASAPSNEVSATVQAKLVHVAFRVKAPAFTPAGDTVYVTGQSQGVSPDPLCGYCGGTASTAMSETAPGSHIWQITLDIPDGTPIQYKYTRGTYDYVEEWGSITGTTNRVATVHANSAADLTETFDDTGDTTADGNHTAVQNWRDALVAATSPVSDAVVAPTTAISVAFNWDVKSDGSDLGTAIAVTAGGAPVSGTVTHDSAARSLVFTPVAPLAPGAYTVTVDHVVSLTPQNDGIKIRTPYVFTFTVPGADPSATATAGTVTGTAAPTVTGTRTVTPSVTVTDTQTVVPTTTVTGTQTVVPTASSTEVATGLPTATASGTPSAPTATDTSAPAATPTGTAGPATTTPTGTATNTPTNTVTHTPTSTSTAAPSTATSTPTVAPLCQLFALPAFVTVPRGGHQVLLVDAAPGSALTLTVKAGYPAHATLYTDGGLAGPGFGRPLAGTRVSGGYRYTFHVEASGLALLAFAIPRDAQPGTVVAQVAAQEPCGLFKTVATFQVRGRVTGAVARFTARATTLMIALPREDTLPVSAQTLVRHGVLRVATRGRGATALRVLTFSYHPHTRPAPAVAAGAARMRPHTLFGVAVGTGTRDADISRAAQ